MWFSHKIDYKYYSKIALIGLYASIPLLIITYKFGLNINEASRWINIPIINQAFQPSDLAKLSLIIYLSSFLAKRQSDIAKFITSFTRPANIDEDKWWLYCTISDTKLLPTFLEKLSNAFMMSDDYVNTLRNICAEQGTISDDESYWVDKYSGYTITAIDWNTDEGYTESGFKIKSREILEADFGDTMVQNLSLIHI